MKKTLELHDCADYLHHLRGHKLGATTRCRCGRVVTLRPFTLWRAVIFWRGWTSDGGDVWLPAKRSERRAIKRSEREAEDAQQAEMMARLNEAARAVAAEQEADRA